MEEQHRSSGNNGCDGSYRTALGQSFATRRVQIGVRVLLIVASFTFLSRSLILEAPSSLKQLQKVLMGFLHSQSSAMENLYARGK